MPDQATVLWKLLCQRIDFFGKAGAPMPMGPALEQALREGALMLPRAYGDGFITQVQSGLPRLLALAQAGQIRPQSLEMVTGAITQHGPGAMLAAPLRRFSAVVSDLYRSFLTSAARSKAQIPLRDTLPPLAAFAHDGSDGPITIAVDLIARVLGGQVGVVSLPATMAEHPILWAALAHETGGHDVTHADPGLLDELSAGLPAVLAGLEGNVGLPAGQLALLWSYWMDEASADVYGLLNVGPAFALNLVVMLAAMGGGPVPQLRVEARCAPGDPSRALDPHPADALRTHLALGVIEVLGGLRPAVRAAYAAQIAAIAAAFTPGAVLVLDGTIQDTQGNALALQASVPLAAMQQAAHAVGRYVASASFTALGNGSIQQIETWDDTDEAIVTSIRAALAKQQPIIGLGDDAQLLAGATLAVFDAPGAYDAITTALNAALDHSFATDPLWCMDDQDHLYIRYNTDAPPT